MLPIALFIPFSHKDLAVLCFIGLDTVADQNQDLRIGTSSLVIRHHMQFVQHMKLAVIGSGNLRVTDIGKYIRIVVLTPETPK